MNIFTKARLIQKCHGKLDIRKFSTTNSLLVSRKLAKLKKQQADYQCDDGKPIWLKGGFCDRILYSGNLIGCAIGLFSVFALVYDHAKPASWKTSTC